MLQRSIPDETARKLKPDSPAIQQHEQLFEKACAYILDDSLTEEAGELVPLDVITELSAVLIDVCASKRAASAMAMKLFRRWCSLAMLNDSQLVTPVSTEAIMRVHRALFHCLAADTQHQKLAEVENVMAALLRRGLIVDVETFNAYLSYFSERYLKVALAQYELMIDSNILPNTQTFELMSSAAIKARRRDLILRFKLLSVMYGC
jgi:hypothetical protein